MSGIAESVFMCGPGRSLAGILCEREGGEPLRPRPGAVFLNAGNVHRVGPNRLYVTLSRSLAERGFSCCRFDLSGIGDSPSRGDGRAFREYAPAETRQVLDDLETRRGVKRFVLVGVCAGADVSLDVAAEDERVAGVILVNGAFVDGGAFAEVYHRAEKRTMRRYYLKRVFSPVAWWRFFTGKSAFWKAIADGLRSKSSRKPEARTAAKPEGTTPETKRKWSLLARRRAGALLVFAEGSVFWDVFRGEAEPAVRDVYPPERIRVVMQKATDHTFTLLSSQNELLETITSWLETQF